MVNCFKVAIISTFKAALENAYFKVTIIQKKRFKQPEVTDSKGSIFWQQINVHMSVILR